MNQAALFSMVAPTKALSVMTNALLTALLFVVCMVPAVACASGNGAAEGDVISESMTVLAARPEKIEVPGTYSGIQELPGGMHIVACKGSKGVCFTIEVEDDGRILLLTKDRALELSSATPVLSSQGSAKFYRYHTSTR